MLFSSLFFFFLCVFFLIFSRFWFLAKKWSAQLEVHRETKMLVPSVVLWCAERILCSCTYVSFPSLKTQHKCEKFSCVSERTSKRPKQNKKKWEAKENFVLWLVYNLGMTMVVVIVVDGLGVSLNVQKKNNFWFEFYVTFWRGWGRRLEGGQRFVTGKERLIVIQNMWHRWKEGGFEMPKSPKRTIWTLSYSI